MTRGRVIASGLSLSAAALIGLAVHEGYRENAYDDGVGGDGWDARVYHREDGWRELIPALP